MSLMSDSAWSSSRGGRDGGWPEGGAPTPAPAAVDRHGDKVWPDSPGGGHSYADLVPEFEPGKPWKVRWWCCWGLGWLLWVGSLHLMWEDMWFVGQISPVIC